MTSPRRVLVAAILVALSTTGCGVAPSGSPSSEAVAAGPVAAGPTVDLTLAAVPGGAGIADAGVYASEPTSNLNHCTQASDGFWRVLYAGGDPWVSVDVLIGASAVAAGHSEDVTAEIAVGSSTYLWIDQPQVRGGDPIGRSSAAIEVVDRPDAITFEVLATSPLRTPDGDGTPVDVHLTVVCPRGG
jgi:hypothetical protein